MGQVVGHLGSTPFTNFRNSVFAQLQMILLNSRISLARVFRLL